MSNCLFEAAFEQILETCHCAPGFHNEGGGSAMEVCGFGKSVVFLCVHVCVCVCALAKF